jgi:hypothetical protein
MIEISRFKIYRKWHMYVCPQLSFKICAKHCLRIPGLSIIKFYILQLVNVIFGYCLICCEITTNYKTRNISKVL